MHTTEYYSNRDVDAQLMVQRLKRHRNITTDYALEAIERLKMERTHAINNYKSTTVLDHELGELRLLVRDRELWNNYCCDDCSHWAGKLD